MPLTAICGSGWPEYALKYYATAGLTELFNYGYHQSVGACLPIKNPYMLLDRNQPSSWVNGTDTMLAQLAKGPVIVGVDAAGW